LGKGDARDLSSSGKGKGRKKKKKDSIYVFEREEGAKGERESKWPPYSFPLSIQGERGRTLPKRSAASIRDGGKGKKTEREEQQGPFRILFLIDEERKGRGNNLLDPHPEKREGRDL